VVSGLRLNRGQDLGVAHMVMMQAPPPTGHATTFSARQSEKGGPTFTKPLVGVLATALMSGALQASQLGG